MLRAVGIKSTLYYNGKVIMSTYDNNSVTNTIVEKEIISDEVINLNSPGCYTAMPRNNKIKANNIYYKDTITAVENPATKSKPGEDLIHAKDLLEMKYFGKTFDDNIHIQIAYNIIDIEKILARYINTIVFSLNNIVMPDKNTDFVGNLYSTTSFQDFKVKKASQYAQFKKYYSNNARLSYFASVFYTTKNGKPQIRSDEEIYSILTFVSQWRQFLFHQNQIASLYTTDNLITKEQKNIIFDIYKNHYESFKRDFYYINKNVIDFLTTALNITTPADAEKFAKRFFAFAARKEHRHIGISIKKLRNIILHNVIIKSTQDTVSSFIRKFWDEEFLKWDNRIRTCIDFCLYNYYLDNKEIRNNLVRQLRNVSCNREEKDKIYEQTATELINVLPRLDKLNYHDVNETYKNKKIDLPIKQTFNKLFTESINNTFIVSLYFLSLFLNQKEKNEMFSELRYKFESIAGFNEVLLSQKEALNYKRDYRIFSSTNFLSHFDNILCTSTKNTSIKCQIFPDIIMSFDNKVSKFDVSNIRNFIRKNIIDSWNYSYLMHYANPKIVYNIVHKPIFSKFVLGGMPNDRLKEYYHLFSDSNKCDDSEMIDYIVSQVSGISFVDIVKEYDKCNKMDRRSQLLYKEKLKKKISLYFTIPYLFVKNLVNVNSRYFMALYALERDSYLFYPSIDIKEDYCLLSRNNKNSNATLFPVKNVDNRAIRIFRNQIAHLNVIQNFNDSVNELNIKKFTTYFEIYHYLLQYQISLFYKKDGKDSSCEKTKQALTDVAKKYHAYDRDFLKMLCLPFSYNLPRYRNLTENYLFNPKNHITADMRSYYEQERHQNLIETT